MQFIQYFSSASKTITFLCLIYLSPLVSKAQTDTLKQKSPNEKLYEQLCAAIESRDYPQALSFINQGADIMFKGGVYKKDVTYYLPKAPVFLYLILPPLLLARRRIVHEYSIRVYYLHLVVTDEQRTPERLKVMEYILQKGAAPEGGQLPSKSFTNPLSLAVQNWDIDAFLLLDKYNQANKKHQEKPENLP